jgi:hypothetical protein
MVKEDTIDMDIPCSVAVSIHALWFRVSNCHPQLDALTQIE